MAASYIPTNKSESRKIRIIQFTLKAKYKIYFILNTIAIDMKRANK